MIAAAELADRLDDPRLRILDLRAALDDSEAGRKAWRESRIPGAVYVDVNAELSDPDAPVAGQLATVEHVRAALGSAGIGPDDEIVAYDDASLFYAPRLAWTADVLGLAPVAVLDGGWPGWIADSARPIERGRPPQPTAAAGPAVVREPQPQLRLTLSDVRAGGRKLVDCRLDRTWQQTGEHIPGARRLPSSATLAADHTLLPAARIAALAADVDLDPDDPITLYCGGGVSATQTLIALRAAGFRDLAVYDGSWAEWSADPNLPRERH